MNCKGSGRKWKERIAALSEVLSQDLRTWKKIFNQGRRSKNRDLKPGPLAVEFSEIRVTHKVAWRKVRKWTFVNTVTQLGSRRRVVFRSELAWYQLYKYSYSSYLIVCLAVCYELVLCVFRTTCSSENMVSRDFILSIQYLWISVIAFGPHIKHSVNRWMMCR
jgi:hypothetical protein